MYYPQEIIEQVTDSNNIVDVISEYVRLTKKGSAYFGLCPFHNEKTPSFSVTDKGDKKMFYCFGCHTGGNVITFLMKHENYSYGEAVQVLAQRAGITLPEPQYTKEESEKHKLREQILEVNKEAALYFFHQLKSEHGRQAYAYLRKRQLSDQTIMNFGLGYSNKYRDDLYKYIKAKGYSDEVMKATGLFVIRETDIHDYFWNRVMFPIMDTRNRVIAFGGRVMGDGEPKYLNSPETPVFSKSSSLFGLHIAKKHKGNDLILCEGYMDVISLHQAGFTNAVASLGTALTTGHARVLKKYASDIFISYDSDSAGRDAAIRAIPMLRNLGLNVKVINLLPYKDPDELIKAEGAEEYRNRIRTARNSFLFEIDVMKNNFDLNDPDSKTAFYNETARRLSLADDDIERENYVQAVAREFALDVQMLRDRTKRYVLNRDGRENYQPVKQTRREKKTVDQALALSQKNVLAYLACHPESFTAVNSILNETDFSISPYDRIARVLFEQMRKGRPNAAALIGSLEEEEDQEKAAGLFSGSNMTDISDHPSSGEGVQTEEDLKRLVNDCAVIIRRNTIEQMINSETDISQVLRLRQEMDELGRINIFQ